MLKVKNVTKSFGDIIAVSDVSFEIGEGEFVFITGPSGAGKTTLLRLILREFLPDSGEIWFDEQEITGLKPKEIPKLRQEIGVVFQDFKVLPEKTLRENVEVALAVIGIPYAEWKDRVDQVLDLVGLIDRQSLFPSQLSGGELQRTSLARALVVNPKIILADEPTGNLDWETADAMMDLFQKINEKGKTIIMATHHKLIIDKMKKRNIVLKKGKLTKEQKESDNKSESRKKET
jgi:cell division transport system ATP-binding protein